MKFHPIYAGRFAMGLPNLDANAPGIIATQSTHKQLASFSQASQIHVKDSHIRGQRRRVEHRRFNESFLQHASTSPFYPLFASLDVGAQMMKGRSGEVLWDDTIRLGIELRKKLRAVRAEFERRESDPARRWFFDPFVPDVARLPDAADERGVHEVPWESIATDALASHAHFWEFSPGARWHGFESVVPGYAITDPNKLTLLTPGFDRTTGEYEAYGIPAPVVAQYLRENRVVPEKFDLNSLLFLLTPGVEASKAGTLVSALVAFKRLHDDNAPLETAIPRFVAAQPKRYRGLRLRDLCREMHDFFRAANVSALQKAQFQSDHLPEPAMTPHEAARQLDSQQCRLPADRPDRGPCRRDAVRGLSARHRHHRAGRAAFRTRAPDDRLSQDVRALEQPVPRLRHRGPGHLSRSRCVRDGPVLHLRGARVTAHARSAHRHGCVLIFGTPV